MTEPPVPPTRTTLTLKNPVATKSTSTSKPAQPVQTCNQQAKQYFKLSPDSIGALNLGAQGHPLRPNIGIEDSGDRKTRRKKGEPSPLSVSFPANRPELDASSPRRQPPMQNMGGLVPTARYAKELYAHGRVYLMGRMDGNNWLAPCGNEEWQKEATWNDFIEMLKSPSFFRKKDKPEPAKDADGNSPDAVVREILRNSKTDIPCFFEDQGGYMKIYFESIGPEEMVVLSFHESPSKQKEYK